MQHEFDTYRQTVDKINSEAKKLGPQGQLDTGAVCQICHKTKFADGVGHMCHYCQLKSCARCGGRMTVKQNKVQLKRPSPLDLRINSLIGLIFSYCSNITGLFSMYDISLKG